MAAARKTSELLQPLLESVTNELPFMRMQSGAVAVDAAVAASNRRCLIQLSVDAMTPVMRSLGALLQHTQMLVEENKNAPVAKQSQRMLLQTMTECLQQQWDERGEEAERLGRDECLFLIKHLCECLHSAMDEDLAMPTSLASHASRMLYVLSARNFEIVYADVRSRLETLTKATDDSEDLGKLQLLGLMRFTSERLRTLLEDTRQFLPQLRKVYQYAVARQLCEAIDKWMTKFPQQFVAWQKADPTSPPASAACHELFDQFSAVAEKTTNRKVVCWPIQMRLLVLRPDVLREVTSSDNHAKAELAARERFLETLKKALVANKAPLNEAALRSWVYVIVSSSFVEREPSISHLKHMVADIETLIKERLFNPAKPFFDSGSGVADENLLVGCLAAFYSLNQRSTTMDLLAQFLSNPDAPILFKTVAVRTLCELKTNSLRADASEGLPSIDFCIQKLARHIRRLLVTTVEQLRATAASLAHTKMNKKEQRQQADTAASVDLLRNLLRLVAMEPLFALFHAKTESGTVFDAEADDNAWYPSRNADRLCFDLLRVTSSLCTCLQDERFAPVSALAADVLVALHHKENIEKWHDTDLITTFWTIGSHVLGSLAMQFVSINREFEESILRLFRDLMDQRNIFIADHEATFSSEAMRATWAQSRTQLEVVLLTSMCSPKAEVMLTMSECINLLCDETDLLQENTEAAIEAAELHGERNPVPVFPQGREGDTTFYRGLAEATAASFGAGAVGSIKAQQKSITKILRQVELPTSGTTTAWDVVYMRCTALIAKLFEGLGSDSLAAAGIPAFGGNTSTLSTSSDTGGAALPAGHASTGQAAGSGAAHGGAQSHGSARVAQELPPELLGMIYFLCSLGGVCVVDDKGRMLQSLSAARKTGKAMSALQLHLRRYLEHLLNLLVCSIQGLGMQLSAAVKDALGHEMHPVLIPMLFELISERMASYPRCVPGAEAPSEQLMLVEQSIAAMRSLLSIEDDRLAQYLALADIEPLLDSFIDFLRQVEHSAPVIKVKLGFCHLLTLVMGRRTELTFRHEMNFRNRMVDKLLAFVSIGSGSEGAASGATSPVSGNAGGSGSGGGPTTGGGDTGTGAGALDMHGNASNQRNSGDAEHGGNHHHYAGGGSSSSGGGGGGGAGAAAGSAAIGPTVWLELDTACIRALSALLQGLPLQALDDEKGDSVDARSTLFLRYFTFLMNITNRCNAILAPHAAAAAAAAEEEARRLGLTGAGARTGPLGSAGTHSGAGAEGGPGASAHSGPVRSRSLLRHRGGGGGGALEPASREASISGHGGIGGGAGGRTDTSASAQGRRKRHGAMVEGPGGASGASGPPGSGGLGHLGTSTVHLPLEGAGLSPALSALLGGNRGGVGLSGIARQRVLQQFRALREATTGAMSNLLGANVEVGLSHAIGMGYHFDAGVRLAFTEVLNKVLHQGAEFETLASTVLSDRYGKLVDLVISPDLHIVNAMSRSTSSEEQDELCKVLVPIFDAENALLPLCARLAAGEARATRAVETLFRGNSLATKLSVATLRLHGQGYLQELLGDTLKSLMAEAGAVSYEVDPNKLDASAQPEEVRARNLANLSALVRRVFAAISNTPLPLPMRVLCLGIRLGIREAFPEAEISAVGALFFLRFVTPALVSPVAHGMLPADTKLPVPVIRALLLLSKVLQTVANQAEFSGVKEVYMQDLNGLVGEILPEMHQFLDSVSTVTALDTRTINAFERYSVPLPASLRVVEGTSISRLSSTSGADGADASGAPTAGGRAAAAAAKAAMGGGTVVEDGLTVSEAHAHALHRLLHIHLDKVGREMTALATGSSSGADARAAARGRATGTFDRLTTLLAQLGEPPKATAENRHHSFAASVDDNKRLEDFLARHRFLATPTSAVEKQQLFFRAAAADGGKNGGAVGSAGSPLAGGGGRPLFCYIARRYNPSELDAEQVMFHVLQLLKPALSSGFDLLVDLTQFSPSNEPSGPTINKFVQLLPPTIVSHVNAVYLLHAPASFRPLAKRLSRQVVTSKLYKKLQFVSMNELTALAPAAAAALPSSTRRLVETMHEFEHVACVGDNKKSAPATVRVGPEAILVLPDERGKVLNHAVRLMDSFAVADMVDLVLPAESKDGLLHVTMRQGAVALAFGGTGVEGLGRALRDVWKRHLLLKPTIDKQWKVMRPADVPGTLLNMALLNLGSSEPRLRQAAYNLLAAATTTFAFQIGGQLLEAHGLAIPENNSSFIIAISQALATRESRLTLEFLDECLTGLRSSTSEQKHLCLEYMQPWLKNLATFEDARVRPVLEGLVAITLRERELYPSLQAKVWFPLGQQERLARLAIGLFVETAAGHGHTSREAATMADAAVTLASANATLVAGVIFEEVLSLLRNSAKSSQPQLEDHACWPRLMTLTRFLVTLSFNNRLDVERYAPEALYTVTMLLGSGSAWTRAAMHAVTVNLTQALCTTLPLSEGQRKGLRLLLEEMVQSKFCLQFGLTGKAAASAELVFRSGGSNLQTQGGSAGGAGGGAGVAAAGGEKSVFGRESLAPVSMGALQAVAEMLWEVVLLSEPADAAWRERWRVLVTASAFRRNPALQPRAFVVLGVVLESIDPNEEPPLVPRALVALAAALQRHDAALADSILLCLARVLRVVPPPQAGADGVSYHLAVFWASVAVLQLREQRLFASALAAMEAALQALELAGHFRGRHVVDVVGACLSLAQEQFTKLEDHCGLSFSRSFDFALGASLLRGFDHSSPSTVSRTSRVLATLLGLERQVAPSVAGEAPASLDASPGGSSSSLLAMAREAELSARERYDSRGNSVLRDTPRASALSRRRVGTAKGATSRGSTVAEDKSEADAALAAALEAATVTPHMLGFLAAILPMADEVRQALETRSARHKYAAMLRPPTLAGEEEAALLVVMMVAKLQRCRRETDRAFLFEFLAEAAEVQPGVFNLVDATLVPLVLEAVTRVPNPDIVESCQRLLRTLLRANLESAGSQLTDLGRLGFGKLASAASFDEKPDSDEGYTIAGAVLDALVPHLVAGKAAAHDGSPIMQVLREEEEEEEEEAVAIGDGPRAGAEEEHDNTGAISTPAPARTPPRRPAPTEAAVVPPESASTPHIPAAKATEQVVGTGPATVAAQRLRAQGVLQKPPSGKPPPPPVSPRVRRTTMDPQSGPVPPRRPPRPHSLMLQSVGGADDTKGAEGADERTSSFA